MNKFYVWKEFIDEKLLEASTASDKIAALQLARSVLIIFFILPLIFSLIKEKTEQAGCVGRAGQTGQDEQIEAVRWDCGWYLRREVMEIIVLSCYFISENTAFN